MANSSSNSGTNISNLPQAPVVADTDLFLIQTALGTQSIPFQNLNVVKTDISGNATVIGDLSGNNAVLKDIQTPSLSATLYAVPGGDGKSYPLDYYDALQVQSGLILSATPTSKDYLNNPIYNNLTSLLPVVSSNIQNLGDSISSNVHTVNIHLSSSIANNNLVFTNQVLNVAPSFITANTFNTVLDQGSNMSIINADPFVQLNAIGPGIPKAWIAFSGESPYTVYSKYNVASISSVGTGVYKITFTTPFADSNYCYGLCCSTIQYTVGNTTYNQNSIVQMRESTDTINPGDIQFLVSSSNRSLVGSSFVRYIYFVAFSL
jgi:hypothetical protein